MIFVCQVHTCQNKLWIRNKNIIFNFFKAHSTKFNSGAHAALEYVYCTEHQFDLAPRTSVQNVVRGRGPVEMVKFSDKCQSGHLIRVRSNHHTC